MLTGCTVDQKNGEIDYTLLIDELYGEEPLEQEDEIDMDYLRILCDGHVTFDYINRFDTFSEMMDDEYSFFVYGKAVEERYNSCFSTYLFIEVYQTEFSDERKIIRIVQMNEDSLISVGGTYVINLSFSEETDGYYFSQQEDSVFRVVSGQIQIPSRFYDELKSKKDIGVFINYIFTIKYY